MDAKELKKLVKTCRELGVLTYKTPELEFSLSHDAPVKERPRADLTNRKASAQYEAENSQFESDTPSDLDILFWSAVNPTERSEEKETE